MRVAYQLRDLTFAYGSCPVINIESLDIREGEIVALVGPNGSGKTTLLHVLAFIEHPTTGRIRFFNLEIGGGNLLAFRRKVGLLLQNPYLFHTSVLANLVWGLKIRGISKKKARQDALEALAVVGLSGFENRYARSLSGGETQRVALARALVLDPEVLLLDEPANHMDKESVQRTQEIVTKLNRDCGKTVILTTHHSASVQTLAHQVLHMVQGNVVAASPDNLFKGRLSQDGNSFETGKMSVHPSVPLRNGSYLTIDPKKIDLSIASSTAESLPNTFRGTINSLSLENGKIEVIVNTGEMLHVLIEKDHPSAAELRLGQAVSVRVPTEAIKVF